MKYFSALVFLLLLSGSARAQLILELNTNFGVPMYNLNRETNAKWYGLSSSLLVQLSENYPILAGARGSFQMYGYSWADYDLPINIVEDDMVIDRITTPLEILSGHSSADLHAFIQVEAPSGTWVPYIRGMIGVRRWWTYSRVFDRADNLFFDFYEDEEEELVISGEINNDWIFSWGGGAGIQIYLNEAKNVLLQAGITYLIGSRTDFLDRKNTDVWQSPNLESGGYNWDLFWEDLNIVRPAKRAKANILFFEVGVQIPID